MRRYLDAGKLVQVSIAVVNISLTQNQRFEPLTLLNYIVHELEVG
jgi:hypothetical protein